MGFTNQPEVSVKFTSNATHPADPQLATVGSGMKLSPEDEEIQWTSGSIVFKCGWGTDTQGNVQAPNLPLTNNTAKTTIEQSDCWTSPFQLDPNDPLNAEALDKIEVHPDWLSICRLMEA